MSIFEIIVYETSNGKEPFNDWLDSLDRSILARVQVRMDRLAEGHFGNARSLKDGVYELKFRSPAFRIYYALLEKQVVLLICGGDKTFQSEDIKKAKVYLADYRRRYET